MEQELGVPAEEVEGRMSKLYYEHGTTLAGLVSEGHAIDFAHWHAAVHGTLEYRDFLGPDPALKEILDRIPLEKWVFTNADAAHAEVCLELLGLKECFKGVICFESIMEHAQLYYDARERGQERSAGGVVCKPQRLAFDLALEAAGCAAAGRAVFLDDSRRNIEAAGAAGIRTVLVGSKDKCTGADYAVTSLHELPDAVPDLFESPDAG